MNKSKNTNNKLRALIKEHVRRVLLEEGFQVTDNIYLSMYDDNIILTQSFGGAESDTGQKIEISMKAFPQILDGLFNLVPVNRIPVNYRQSMIAKLSDKAIDQETDLGAEKPDGEFKGKGKSEKGGGGKEKAPEEEGGGEEEEGGAAGGGENPFA
jgi:hypothetical protein